MWRYRVGVALKAFAHDDVAPGIRSRVLRTRCAGPKHRRHANGSKNRLAA
jgi:hypothetical protein